MRSSNKNYSNVSDRTRSRVRNIFSRAESKQPATVFRPVSLSSADDLHSSIEAKGLSQSQSQSQSQSKARYLRSSRDSLGREIDSILKGYRRPSTRNETNTTSSDDKADSKYDDSSSSNNDEARDRFITPTRK
jgi:hypothetical protein